MSYVVEQLVANPTASPLSHCRIWREYWLLVSPLSVYVENEFCRRPVLPQILRICGNSGLNALSHAPLPGVTCGTTFSDKWQRARRYSRINGSISNWRQLQAADTNLGQLRQFDNRPIATELLGGPWPQGVDLHVDDLHATALSDRSRIASVRCDAGSCR